MVERILSLPGEPHLIDERGRQKSRREQVQCPPRSVGQAEPRADHRCCVQRLLGFRIEPVDARGDGRLQRGGNTDLGQICAVDM